MKAELIDHMGDDLTVVNAARVSFDKKSEYIQRRLAKDYEWEKGTPIQYHDDVEYEFKYEPHEDWALERDSEGYELEVDLKQSDKRLIKYLADHNHWTPFSHGVITMRETVPAFVLNKRFDCTDNFSYNEAVTPEQARMVLPQSMMTSYYVTGSLAAWARAYRQRINNHSQLEIQMLAKQWGEIIEPLFPESWKALTSG